MKSVSVSHLKARLSRYLREVKRGGEVQIVERGVPIARIVGLKGVADGGRRQRLIEAGVLSPGKGGLAELLRRSPPIVVPGVDLRGALDEDREDRF
mgnify:CR=1 FL=1